VRWHDDHQKAAIEPSGNAVCGASQRDGLSSSWPQLSIRPLNESRPFVE
jgi:hypothetical protein